MLRPQNLSVGSFLQWKCCTTAVTSSPILLLLRLILAGIHITYIAVGLGVVLCCYMTASQNLLLLNMTSATSHELDTALTRLPTEYLGHCRVTAEMVKVYFYR